MTIFSWRDLTESSISFPLNQQAEWLEADGLGGFASGTVAGIRTRASLEEDLEEEHDILETLEGVGLSIEEVTDQLLQDGVRLFAEAFDRLLNAIDRKCKGKVPWEYSGRWVG